MNNNVWNSTLRNGNFTSSEIVALTKMDRSGKNPGKPFFTYIEECNMERRLNRSLCEELSAHAVLWGKLCEKYVFDLLDTSYKMVSDETLPHPEIDCWAGSPDVRKFIDAVICDTVGDIKCPKTLKSFCQLVDAWIMDGIDGIREKHNDGDKFYWQLVSNACITGATFGELIVFAPYKSQLIEIRKACEGDPNYYWLFGSSDDQLPWLPDGGYYKNINIMRFQIPQRDKDFLRQRVLDARELLVERPKLIAA